LVREAGGISSLGAFEKSNAPVFASTKTADLEITSGAFLRYGTSAGGVRKY
jgi:hypothetical protein